MSKLVTLPTCDQCNIPLKILLPFDKDWIWICPNCDAEYTRESKKATAELVDET